MRRYRGLVFTFFAYVFAIAIGTLVFVIPMSVSSAEALRSVLMCIDFDILNHRLVNYEAFYITFFAIYGVMALSFGVILVKRSVKPRRDAKYLLGSLKSENVRSPAIGLEQLVGRVVGVCDDQECRAQVEKLIVDSIMPIKDFLEEVDAFRNTLIVEGLWGSGKTTSVLVSSNEVNVNIQKHMRYIYESAFKYNGNIFEFERDILEAIYDIMSEMGISAGVPLGALAKNLDSNPLKSFISTLYENAMPSSKMLTSDLVRQINKRYNHIKDCRKLHVIVVLDDIDRLQGEDIVRMLSFISIIRRINFVRLILPIDASVVQYSLKQAHIMEPALFMKKYIPEFDTIKVRTDYEMVEQIALRTIAGRQERVMTDIETFRAAWAAIVCKLFSERLKYNAKEKNWNSTRCTWLGVAYLGYPHFPEEVDPASSGIMFATYKAMKDCLDNNHKYRWGSRINGGGGEQRFEDVVLGVVHGSAGFPVRDRFNEEAYDVLISSWIFAFANEQWGNLAVSLREVLDMIGACDVLVSDMGRRDQFVYVFNQLFADKLSDRPKEIIETLKENEKNLEKSC